MCRGYFAAVSWKYFVSCLPNDQDFIYLFILYTECNMRTENLFGRLGHQIIISGPDN